jgi:UDP-N-acetylmuramyl pentapeptide phosphotransferase/UDP-N-acetylglucosamine-1-phosphate transferase
LVILTNHDDGEHRGGQGAVLAAGAESDDGRGSDHRPIGVELAATAAGGALLAAGLAGTATLPVLVAAVVLTTTLQPLVKVSAGTALGIRYSYAYIRGIEPRFKMRYGTYLAAPRWRRIVLHLSGTVGSLLALWLVRRLALPELPGTAVVCGAAFWIVAAMNAVPFLAGLAGVHRLGPVGTTNSTSGGAAALELRGLMSTR